MTSDQVVDLLYEYANEAEKPGTDILTGKGILNVGRIENRKVDGIQDAVPIGQPIANVSVHVFDDAQEPVQEPTAPPWPQGLISAIVHASGPSLELEPSVLQAVDVVLGLCGVVERLGREAC